jgi:hypothetical protein
MLIVIMQHSIFPPFDAFEFIELRASIISRSKLMEKKHINIQNHNKGLN